MILDAFKEELKKNTAEQAVTVLDDYDPTTGDEPDSTFSYEPLGNCLFWIGRQAESLVSDRIKGITDAVAAFEIILNVTSENLKINGIEYEVIARPDSSSYDGELILVALKELT